MITDGMVVQHIANRQVYRVVRVGVKYTKVEGAGGLEGYVSTVCLEPACLKDQQMFAAKVAEHAAAKKALAAKY